MERRESRCRMTGACTGCGSFSGNRALQALPSTPIDGARRRCPACGIHEAHVIARHHSCHPNTRMVNQNWWITTLMINSHKYCPPLTRDIECDVLIVGGGFSGVSAAAEFLRKGLRVVLIEKNIVGGSSSGRSAGFLTPDSELELHQLVRRYGTAAAAEIWEAPCRGIERIVSTLKKHDIQCGLLQQDSLFLGLGAGGTEAVDVRARVPRKRRLHRSAHLRRESAAADSRRAGLHRGHPVRRHVRSQSAGVPAGVEGSADRQRHAGLREHGDGPARRPHGPYARRHA